MIVESQLKTLIYCFMLLFSGLKATINPGPKSKSTNKLAIKAGPQEESVFNRQLVQEEPHPKDILIHNAAYYKDTSVRKFNNTVMGYVTPWNSHGYDVAKIFGPKFDLIAPVWLQITKKEGTYKIQGTHDIDNKWIEELRRINKKSQRKVQIFPRIIVEHLTKSDITELLKRHYEQINFADAIIDACQYFDGIVFEFTALLAGRINANFVNIFIKGLARKLQHNKMHMVLVVPPTLSREIFNYLYQDVYAFSINTYDYSNVQRPGANAPLYWIREVIENLTPNGCDLMKNKREKILMGINMYGYDYTPDGGSPITGNAYLKALHHLKKRLTLDDKGVENFFEMKTDTGRHLIFYPTLYSINKRIELAKEVGVGIAIWELGQGLDYFYDLF